MMKLFVLVLATVVASATANVYFQEEFGSDWDSRWIKANREGLGEFDVTAGTFYGDEEADKGLHTSQDARFYGIAAPFPKPFSNEGKDLVIQFSVKHQQSIDCGGGYVKVLTSGDNLEDFNGETEYAFMFGPDICGATKRVHVIVNYKGENHLISKTIPAMTDVFTHVYTLIVHPDQTYEVRIDGEEQASGSLLEDWDFLPPKMIQDPAESKPADWVDTHMIDDPEDVKPAGYDDIAATITDPEAEMPDDWDEEADGEYEAPEVPNPEYQGPWQARQIPNPDYKGPWEHPMIANPDYAEDATIYQFDTLAGIGFDLWQVKAGTIFDNIFVGDDVEEAEAFLASTYSKNIAAEKEAKQVADAIEAAEKEAARAAPEEDYADDEYDMDEEENVHDEL